MKGISFDTLQAQRPLEGTRTRPLRVVLLELTALPYELAEFEVRRSAAVVRTLLCYLLARELKNMFEHFSVPQALLAVGLLAACLLALRTHSIQAAARCAVGVLLFKLLLTFPNSSNHFLIELLSVAFAALCDLRDGQRRMVCFQALRWLPAAVMLWSGLQKVLYGTYATGAFLASAIRTRAFEPALRLLLSEPELMRVLHAADVMVPGELYLSEPLALVVSNGIYLAEIAIGGLLLVPRFRAAAAAGSLPLLFGIQVAAQEVMFGLLMVNLMLLYLPRSWPWMACAINVAVYAIVLLSASGLVQLGELN